MTGEGRHGRTAAVFFLVFLALSWVTVEGGVFSREKRRDVPQELDLGEARRLLEREKRAAGTSAPPTGSANQVLLNEFTLNGTERHRRAYVHWSAKKNSDVMYILTLKYNYTGLFADSQLWKSTDYGSTFSPYSFGKGVHASFFYVSPADPTKLVFTDIQHKCMYATHDELHTYQNRSLPVASDYMILHPTNSKWIVLFDYKKGELYLTTDFGTSWKHFLSDVLNFRWGVPGIDAPEIAHLEIRRKDSDDSFYMRCTLPGCNSSGDGIDTLLGPFLPWSLLVSNEYIFAQKVLQDGKESHMMVSYKRGNFSNAYFPNSIRTQDFLVLDTSEGQVFLAVNHGRHQGASVYLSDPKGQYYVLSLTNVHHQAFRHWFDVDMHKVKGLNGTYLANQQSKKNFNNLTSLISFNKGGDWKKIPSPQANCKNENCSLVLRLDMNSRYRNWILSEKEVPNFIIAHGHYGPMFEYGSSNLSVFTSRDGGWTWKEAPLQGLYHFNILDQGSVITAIKAGYMEQTNDVYYTFNEGGMWQSEKFKHDNTVHVIGVLTEPGIKTLVMNVYGHVRGRDSPWTVVKVNFSQVLPRQCDSAKDYVPWSPSDHDNNLHENCLLGQVVSYQCRNVTRRCSNGEDFVRTVSKTVCNCTDEDFECDFGFFPKKGGGCQKETWFDAAFIAPECIEGQPYSGSQGYRKVGSDKCTGGVANNAMHKPSSTICPTKKPESLLLTANATLVATGQPVLFHLIQRRGSVHHTQYSWNFSDYYRPVKNMTGLSNAQHQVKIFRYTGLFYVSVRASNSDGVSVSNLVPVRVERPIRKVAVFNVRTARVGDRVTVLASTQAYFGRDSSLHYQYRFGDESRHVKDLLTYASNATHTYNRSGTYTLSVTALNSVSAATKQVPIVIIEDGILAQLNFSERVDSLFYSSYPSYNFYMLDLFQEELTKMLGIKLERLVLSINATRPVRIDCLILPKPRNGPAYVKTAERIAKDMVDMVDNHTLDLFLDSPYMRYFGDINVTAIHIVDYSGHGAASGNKSSNCSDHGQKCKDHGHNCTHHTHNCTHHHSHNCTDHSHNCTHHHGHNCTHHTHNCTHHDSHNCTDHSHNCTHHHGRNCTDHSHNGTHCHSHNCTDHSHNGTDNTGHPHKGSDKSNVINYRAIYIAVPVAAVAAIVTVIIIVIYRRRSRAKRYSLLNRDGSADPFFDEDDDLPLDMSDARDTGGDEPMLDLRTGN